MGDGGRLRELEVARDELHSLNASVLPALRRIPALNSVEEVCQYAQRLHRASGQELDLVLYPRGQPHTEYSRRLLTRDITVKLRDPKEVNRVAASLGVTLAPLFPELPNWHVCTASEAGGALALASRLRSHPGVLSAQAGLAQQHQKKVIPNDTFFSSQWPLRNVGQNGGTAGIDLNVATTWNTYRGTGIVIRIVDDGLQSTHPDLAPNYNAALSYDFNFNDPDPAPNLAVDTHGTSVAGLAGARGNNGMGVSGAAPEASLAGLRLLGGSDTDAQDAAAMLYRNDLIWVKNNSWGAADGTGQLLGGGPLWAEAMATSALTGRGGQGTVFVFAGGNGRTSGDNVNYDGYANSLYALAVSAVNDLGQPASYSEPGACLVVAAPSSDGTSFCAGGRQQITTTDLTGTDGYNDGSTLCELPDADYTRQFGGTSAAAPMVSGVVALLLQANPNLSCRDVTEILMRSATKVSPADSDWWTNASGLAHNHKLGAGLVNAGAAVTLGLDWANLAPLQTLSQGEQGLSVAIPDNNPAGVVRSFFFTNEAFRVERVALTLTAPHSRYGDLAITLISPAGTQSRLAELHSSQGSSYDGWTLTTVRHWGEQVRGTWKVQIADLSPSHTGSLQELQLLVQGSNPHATLSITTSPVGQRVNLRAPAPGWTYLLEISNDLQLWQALGITKLDAHGRGLFFDASPVTDRRFYRARLLP